MAARYILTRFIMEANGQAIALDAQAQLERQDKDGRK